MSVCTKNVVLPFIKPTIWCMHHKFKNIQDRAGGFLTAGCWYYSFNQSSPVAAIPSWITLAHRNLTIGNTIYIANMTHFFICFYYAKALPFDGWTIFSCFLYLFLFIIIVWTPYPPVPWGTTITLKDWLWYGGILSASGSLDPTIKSKLSFWPLRLVVWMVRRTNVCRQLIMSSVD